MDINGLTVLVTGGAGLIGSHIVDLLVTEYQCKVRVLDNLVAPTHTSSEIPPWVPKDVEFIHGSTFDRSTMEQALQGVDVVFHQAASGYVGSQENSLRNVFDAAATGTCVLFDTIKDLKLPVKKVVTASSMAVYGESSYLKPDGSIFTPSQYRSAERMANGDYEVYANNGSRCQAFDISEERQLLPSHPYHLAKFIQEKVTLASGRELGIPTVALRYSICHGPRQSIRNPYSGVVSIFATRIINGKRPVVFEDGKQLRDFVYVEDVARANICVMKSAKAKWEVYNVGTNRGGDTMNDIASLMCKYLSKGNIPLTPLNNGAFRVFDTRHILLDASKLMSLGWKPKYTLEEGLKKHAEWILKLAETRQIKDMFEEEYVAMLAKGVVKQEQ
jgi:dTDP-L-rhamnose 4-epimerase